MDILVGCEESGTVRDAFIAQGHNAYSCDLLPSRGECRDYHFQEDIISCINRHDPFDIIIIFPDCTTVCCAGNRYYAGTQERTDQIQWIKNLWELAKSKSKIGCALENPASVIWPVIRPLADQVQFVQPWQFGHQEQKKTGLALFNLPPLKETKNVYQSMMLLPIAEREKVWTMPPSPTRKRDRAKTYSGIAKAMANQWGSLDTTIKTL